MLLRGNDSEQSKLIGVRKTSLIYWSFVKSAQFVDCFKSFTSKIARWARRPSFAHPTTQKAPLLSTRSHAPAWESTRKVGRWLMQNLTTSPSKFSRLDKDQAGLTPMIYGPVTTHGHKG